MRLKISGFFSFIIAVCDGKPKNLPYISDAVLALFINNAIFRDNHHVDWLCFLALNNVSLGFLFFYYLISAITVVREENLWFVYEYGDKFNSICSSAKNLNAIIIHIYSMLFMHTHKTGIFNFVVLLLLYLYYFIFLIIIDNCVQYSL